MNKDNMWVLLLAVCGLVGIGCELRLRHLEPIPIVNTLDRPPIYLSINGERWVVSSYQETKHTGYGDHTGESSCGQREIWYDGDLETKAELRETLWHEVAHALLCNMEKDDKANWKQFTSDSPEHEAVYIVGMKMPGFVHDNPEFIKWAEDWK